MNPTMAVVGVVAIAGAAVAVVWVMKSRAGGVPAGTPALPPVPAQAPAAKVNVAPAQNLNNVVQNVSSGIQGAVKTVQGVVSGVQNAISTVTNLFKGFKLF